MQITMNMMPFWGFFAGLIYLVIVIYVLVLATRFTKAVERIARSLESRPGPE